MSIFMAENHDFFFEEDDSDEISFINPDRFVYMNDYFGKIYGIIY